MSHSNSQSSDKFLSKSRSESVESSNKHSSCKNGGRTSRSPGDARSYSRSVSSRNSRMKSRRKSSSASSRRKDVRRKSISRSPQRIKKVGRGNRTNPEPNNCIGVFGLSPKTTEDDLYSIFDRYGKVERLHLVTDRYTKESRGYCFINYQNVESATKAVTKADGMDIDGRPVRADYSITQRPHTPTPGQYMGKRTDRPRGGIEERGGYGDRDRERGGYQPRVRGNYEELKPRSRRRSRSNSPPYRRRSRSGSPPYRTNRSRSYDRSRRRNGAY